jgi:cation diffusion facilitator CzcD-associated flavoprotein CzcO
MAVIQVDALVVGAGFGGIYQTYQLKKLGLNVRCIEKGGGVGGTWYWNRYPGAMSDTEAYLYRYSWDKEDLITYPWTTRYVYQPEILQYLNHVVDRHGLRDLIHLHTEMTAAHWDDQLRSWRVVCAGGTVFVARYLLNALGLLSTPNFPSLPRLDSYKGRVVHTASWPADLDLRGKSVGIIGNGSTGVQVMTALAPVVGQLTSYQRHPQYSVPAGQKPISKEYRQHVNENYDAIYEGVWKSSTGFGVPEVSTPMMSVSPEERQRTFQSLWDQGNAFRFLNSGFGDIMTNEEANKETCRFIHSKIDQIVRDPEKARVLKPKELYARRPLCDTGYYQIFNRDNVKVISLQETPITSIVPEGIQTADGHTREHDILIFATGFDAVDGSYLRVNIQGRNGETLKQHWEGGGSNAFAAVAVSGFPNMFIISGPQGPFANFPCAIECEVNFITEVIKHAEQSSTARTRSQSPKIEVRLEAEEAWKDVCVQATEGSLLKTAASWIFGENIPGRKPVVKFYFHGLKGYLDVTAEEKARGFPSFILE